MKIRDWEGIALIIGVGDIGTSLSDYLRAIAPKLDVICYWLWSKKKFK